MALRNILKEGDETLSKRCRPVTDFNDRLHQLLDDMAETLTAAEGVGLAAPQVGILRRAVLVLETNVPEGESEKLIELINPEILSSDGEQEGPEGCLSVPGVYGWVKRPDHVRVRAQDRFGEFFEIEGYGLTARAFCHEVDHLDGHVFLEISDHIMSDEELEEYYATEDGK
ncbi:MAG: peptide deformylase [Oscillospiraceae bacterium]|nr:peptide deformylase [Oscillospiraceae bacterium]MCD7749905.1 peptide deformylase [Oscillospiraceae bacterium]